MPVYSNIMEVISKMRPENCKIASRRLPANARVSQSMIPWVAVGCPLVVTAMEVALATGLRRLMMKTIGLIGGMSRESTAVYYRQLSEQVVILGCTEIGLLIRPKNIDLPAFDSTLLHADAAVEFALGDGPLGRADAA
jgi:hypothetical protein